MPNLEPAAGQRWRNEGGRIDTIKAVKPNGAVGRWQWNSKTRKLEPVPGSGRVTTFIQWESGLMSVTIEYLKANWTPVT